ncbi:MAG: transposase family protein [Gammaproteobacteria bacterium]|nr:transposase family protein [Gammaproteobacteria bacterium]
MKRLVPRRSPLFSSTLPVRDFCGTPARQLCLVFDLEINKDVIRRVLAKHYRPDPGAYRPSWLSVLGHAKDSLWSIDLFRCESLMLKSHWVLVVMDQYTRRIIGFGVHAGAVDGPSLCRMFNRAIREAASPRYISSDNDPLFRFHQWKANLRILEVTEVKTVPYLPISHPLLERLIGTIRREYLDFVPFWTARDLENKLLSFEEFYNDHRCHYALNRDTRGEITTRIRPKLTDRDSYRWQSHCRGLHQLPVAA